MTRLYSIGLETLAGLIFLLPLLLLLIKLGHGKLGKPRTILLLLFVTFLTAVFAATGVLSLSNLVTDYSVNIIPLRGAVLGLGQFCLNILLFLPLGLLLPLLWYHFTNWKIVALYGFSLSLFIEISQLFTYRSSDFDDLLANTLGAVLGFFLIKLVAAKTPLSLATPQVGEKSWPYQAYALALLTFLVMFLLQPFIADLFWSWLI